MSAFRPVYCLLLFIGSLAFATAQAGQAKTPSSAARPQAMQSVQGDAKDERAGSSGRDVEEMVSAVVKIRMKALPDARSNANLGSTREGTGVVVDDKGHIVTIGYIVNEADSIELTTWNNRTVPAVLAAYDHATGFGLLRATLPPDVRPMPLGEAADLEIREPVMVLPAGGREAASIVYVISKRPFAASWEYLLDTAIFTTPPILQWSGAALVNHEGRLVGIGSLLVRDAGGRGEPVPGNMFVPIDGLKPILADLIATGKRAEPPRPWLGLSAEPIQGRLFVLRVSPDGPADRAGIRPGDIVLGIDGEPVKSLEELYRRMWRLGAAGTEVPLTVLHGADLRELRVRSIDRRQYSKGKKTY